MTASWRYSTMTKAAGPWSDSWRPMLCRLLAYGAAVALVLTEARATWSENPDVTARVSVVATGLEAPWALAFGPTGDLFITGRPGRIRVIRDGQLLPEPAATLTVAAVGEGGLMGLAIGRAFESNRFLYVCYTAWKERRLVNRVVRLTARPARQPFPNFAGLCHRVAQP